MVSIIILRVIFVVSNFSSGSGKHKGTLSIDFFHNLMRPTRVVLNLKMADDTGFWRDTGRVA